MSTLTKLGSNMLYGTARTTGRFGAVGAVGYAGYNWLENRVGSTGAKLLLGASGLAIAYAAFSGIRSAISNTANLIKNAAIAAVVGVGGYALYQYFNRASNTPKAPEVEVNPLGIEDTLRAIPRTRTTTPNTVDPALARAQEAAELNASNPARNMAADAFDDVKGLTPTNIPAVDRVPTASSTIDSVQDTTRPMVTLPADMPLDEALDNAITRPPPAPVGTVDNVARALQDVTSIYENGGMEAVRGERKAMVLGLRSGRWAANIPVLGTAAGLGVGGVLAYFIPRWAELDRLYCQELVETEVLSQEACDAFVKTSGEIQTMLLGDLATSTADWTGFATLPITAGVEYAAYRKFQNWIDRYAPHLDPAIAEELSMSLFTPNTVHSEILSDLEKALPLTTEGYPAELRAVIEANIDMHGALSAPFNPNAHRIYDPEVREQVLSDQEHYWGNLTKAKETLTSELTRVLETPNGFKAALAVLDTNDRINIVERLFESEETQHDTAINIANNNFNDLNAFFNNLHRRQIDFSSSQTQNLLETAGLKEIYGDTFFDGLTQENHRELLAVARDIRDLAIDDAHSDFEAKMDELATRHPKVVDYVQNYGYWTNYEPWRTLEDKPELMHKYIMERFGFTTEDTAPTLAPDSTSDMPMSSSEIRESYTAAADPASLSANFHVAPEEPIRVASATPPVLGR